MKRQTPGKLVLFLIILALVFPLFSALIRYVVSFISALPSAIEYYYGEPKHFIKLYEVSLTILKWLSEIFTVETSLAILIIISIIYAIITKEEPGHF